MCSRAMKYVLRNKMTGCYLKRKGLWVRRMDEALTFEDLGEVREYCQALGLDDDVQPIQRLMPYLLRLLRQTAKAAAPASAA